jgi:spore cortex formation protein SpoVR/YcgB (stage V sporulation)
MQNVSEILVKWNNHVAENAFLNNNHKFQKWTKVASMRNILHMRTHTYTRSMYTYCDMTPESRNSEVRIDVQF